VDLVDRFPLYPLILSFVIYPIFAWMLLAWSPQKIRMQLFAILNIAGLALFCLLSGASNVRLKSAVPYSEAALLFFSFYVLVVILHYVSLHLARHDQSVWPTVTFLSPILLLLYVKYASDYISPFKALLTLAGVTHVAAFFIGISYLSFRLVHLAQEVRNDLVEMPTIWEYLSFAFFVPTLSIGPINPYSKFIGSMRAPSRENTPLLRSLLRILVGFTKYIFLGSFVAQFTYAGLLRNGHPHGKMDLVIAIPAYAVYLYLNFSGFCDMVIGASGLLQIEVMENFDRPFLSRNFQEFWSRWHITLSAWIRDLVFTPLSKSLMRKFGAKSANHAIAASIFISFIGVGIWHGKGLNFLIFGVSQGLGLVAVHYYTIWLKKYLGREKFAAYRKNKLIRFVATVMTFIYFSLTLFLFANTWDQMRIIRAALQ
jgi:D-alanyl-lipoteichoic acid acyltransferase DltB (MBOAT superfamily)